MAFYFTDFTITNNAPSFCNPTSYSINRISGNFSVEASFSNKEITYSGNLYATNTTYEVLANLNVGGTEVEVLRTS